MKSTGIVRRIDELGRIVLPIELRKTFNINERDALEIFTENDSIVLKKHMPSDVFTGSTEELIEYRGIKVSLDSVKELANIAGYRLLKKDNE